MGIKGKMKPNKYLWKFQDTKNAGELYLTCKTQVKEDMREEMIKSGKGQLCKGWNESS